MDVKFVEAGQDPEHGGNWGKFMVCRYTTAELTEPAQMPGAFPRQRLVSLHGDGREHIWLLDLATGEGARFHTLHRSAIAARDQLNKHRIHVCVLYEALLVWLFEFMGDHEETWWDDLPRLVELPDVAFEMYGYRRPGPAS